MSFRYFTLIFPLLTLVSLGTALSVHAETQQSDSTDTVVTASAESNKPTASQFQSKLEAIAAQSKPEGKEIATSSMETRTIELSKRLQSLDQEGSGSFRPAARILAKIEKLQAKLQNNAVETSEKPNSPQVSMASVSSASEQLKTDSARENDPAASHMQTLIRRLDKNNLAAKSRFAVTARSYDVHPGLAGVSSNVGDLQNSSESQDGVSKAQSELATDANSSTSESPANSNVQAVTSQPTATPTAASVKPSLDLQPTITTSAALATQTGATGKASDLASPNAPQTVAQSLNTMGDSDELTELKNKLMIDPILVEAPTTYPPSLSFGAPSAFGPQWGDAFIGLSAATAGNGRDSIDGGLNVGFGLGNSKDLIGIGFAYNVNNLDNFGQSGSFDLSASRILYAGELTQVAIGGGWNSFAHYGDGIVPGGWGALTAYTILQPNDPINPMPLLVSVGAGGGGFRQDPASTGVFGGIGLQLAPQLGTGIAWSGVGLNVGLSWVPVPTVPLTLVATGADLTDNSPGGPRFILSLSYGYNFLPSTQNMFGSDELQ